MFCSLSIPTDQQASDARCPCSGQAGPCQPLGRFGLPGFPVGSWQWGLESCSMSLLQSLPLPSPPWAAATSPGVPEDLHHPAGDVGGHQNGDGACWGPRAGKAMGASAKWGLSFHCCFCSSNRCAEIKAFVCLFSPTFLISLCAGLPYSPSSTFNL